MESFGNSVMAVFVLLLTCWIGSFLVGLIAGGIRGLFGLF